MAKKELIRFCSEYLPAHPDVRANIGAIADEHQFATAMVDAGAKAGFDFSEGDIQEVMGASGRSPVVDELSDDELSDKQLDAVAGGGFLSSIGKSIPNPTKPITRF